MKKFLYLALANIAFLFLLPILIKHTEGENANNLIAQLVVLGNSLYFMFQSQFIASKNDKPWIYAIFNLPFILVYMYVFLAQIVPTYLIFYYVMMFLGIRIGSIKKKISDMQQK